MPLHLPEASSKASCAVMAAASSSEPMLSEKSLHFTSVSLKDQLLIKYSQVCQDQNSLH